MRAGSAISLITVAVVALAALVPSDAVRAQESYPDRPVRVVVPYPAGGGTDTLARLVADQLSRRWGQPRIVENVGGAAGNIGAAEVARAKPDGYTLLLASPGPIATNGFLYKEMAYDPARWVPIALLATGPTSSRAPRLIQAKSRPRLRVSGPSDTCRRYSLKCSPRSKRCRSHIAA